MQDLSSIQRDLLFVLSGLDEPTGMDVKREIEQAFGNGTSTTNLYKNLDALHEKGLIQKHDDAGRSNHYTISDRGRREVEAHHSWQREYLQVEGTPS